MSTKAKRWSRALAAALSCPCHLPILVIALSGTAAGALLADYMAAAVAIMVIVFVVSLRGALRGFGEHDRPIDPGRSF